VIDAAVEFCSECGYNLGTGQGSDTAVYQDLAQANLSRMRGDRQGAIDRCLKVLRAFPNNVTAHSLLGEIHMEHGDLKQAAEWFEMALDLDPRAARERQLLDKVKAQMTSKESAAHLEKLEIKPRSGLTALWAGMIGLILVVGLASFFIGQNLGRKKGGAEVAQGSAEPIRIPASGVATPAPVNPDEPTSSPAPTAPAEDVAALQQVMAKAQKGALVRSLMVLPGGEEVIITAAFEEGVPLATTAMMVAADVFVGRGATRTTTVRLVKGETLVFVGEIGRALYDEIQGLSGGSESMDALGIRAFPSAWYARSEDRPGTPVKPADESAPAEPEGSAGTASPESGAGSGE
jgi:hypothetical protein